MAHSTHIESAAHVKTGVYKELMQVMTYLQLFIRQWVIACWRGNGLHTCFDCALKQVDRLKSKGLSPWRWTAVWSVGSGLNKPNNWYESCLQLFTQLLLHITSTPLPLPESSGYGHDGVYTFSLCSGGQTKFSTAEDTRFASFHSNAHS